MKAATSLLLRRCSEGRAAFRTCTAGELLGEEAWSGFGVRDPSLLNTPEGEPVVDAAGQFSLYFNARDRDLEDGGVTCVGLASGTPHGEWSVRPQPVFADAGYAAQGSVLRLAPDHYRLYYSPDTLLGFAVASSTDGLNWRRLGDPLILRPEPFSVRRMGLPVVRRIRGRWVMVFEGIANGRFHIYLAFSSNGLHWQAGNHGKPVYTPAPGAWDCLGQANPSLYVSDDAEQPAYVMLYNGCAEVHGWDIGILFSEALEGPWRPAPAPVLRRGRAGEWDGGRVEGARLVERPGYSPSVVYFALPTVNSYRGGRIAYATIEATAAEEAMACTESERNAAAERAYNDQLALRYFDVWDHFPIQRFMTEVESELIEHAVRPSSEVILLGSGGGRELPVLLAKACRVTAVDISPQMLTVGRQRYSDAGVAWIEADVHDLPEQLVGFDAAICLGAVFN